MSGKRVAKKRRVVLAGCGGITKTWLGPALARRDLALVGVVDLDRGRAQALAQRHHLQAVTGADLRAVIEETGADTVFDCTVPEAHAQVVCTALRCGCDVLGEKPMADTLANARRMVRTAARTGRRYAVIQNRRYLPGIRALQRFLAAGRLGRITTVQSDFFIGAHFGGFRERMRHVLLLDMAIHTFDAARYLAGADAVRVLAHDWNPAGSWYRHGAAAAAIFEMTGGIRYVYHGSWCSEGRNTSWECDWRIIGTRGSITWDGNEDFRVEVVKKSGGFFCELRPLRLQARPLPARRIGHAGLIDDFMRSLRTGEAPLTDCTDNIKSLAMVHAAIRSAEQKRWVRVPR